MDKKVRVYIEIEQNSNLKFEYNHNTKNLELDRILQEPFVYPYPYGFILDTKAKDDDELDALILTNKKRISFDILFFYLLISFYQNSSLLGQHQLKLV